MSKSAKGFGDGWGESVETFGEKERGLVRGFNDGERERDERLCEWERRERLGETSAMERERWETVSCEWERKHDI